MRLIIYDDQCMMCNGFIKLLDKILKEDVYITGDPMRAIKLGLIGEEDQTKILSEYKRTIIFKSGQKYLTESKAISEILKYGNKVSRVIGICIDIANVLGLGRPLYRVIARNRKKIGFGFSKKCMISTKNLRVL